MVVKVRIGVQTWQRLLLKTNKNAFVFVIRKIIIIISLQTQYSKQTGQYSKQTPRHLQLLVQSCIYE